MHHSMRLPSRLVVAVTILSVIGLAAAETLAAGPGIFRSRNGSGGQPATRTYRSYSVSPGASNPAAPVPGEAAPAWEGSGVTSRPLPSAPMQPRQSTRSKPSYMRADSKASGRFGQ
jgi:hypothetical protein